MERLTFDGNFCDISQCRYLLCPHYRSCAQKQVWERLKAYEDSGLSPQACAEAREIDETLSGCDYSISRMVDLMKADVEGHVDSRGRQFFVSVSKNKWDEFYKIAGDNIGATHEFESVIQVGLIGLSDQSRAVLKKCGKGAKNKLLPVECISLNSELSKCLFDGYMSGDGHKTKNGHIMFTSVSRALLLGMAIVSHRAYGYIPAIYGGRGERTGKILGRTVHQSEEWVMTASPNYSFCHVDGDTTWHKVRKANIEHGIADVWSIEVDENHSFTAEGCIVKNCPLQLTVIRRALNLWSNPGDTVLSPFMGIGSEGVVSLQNGRRFVGVELKPTWYEQSVKNCAAVTATEQQSLW